MTCSLTQDSFDGLLASLADDQEKAGQKYLEIRRNLVRLFEWRGCATPDEYADETMNRCARKIAEGAEIRTLSPFDLSVMIARGSEALDSVRSLAKNLDAVVGDFRQSMGERQITQTFGALSEIVEEVRHGQGTLHSLIYEPYKGSAVQNLDASLTSLASILAEVEHGHGVLHALVYEKPSEQDVVLQILEAGAKLNTILGRIERGDGTLGLLLNDPTLYEELKLLVGGANRSTLVRSVVNLVSPDRPN